jgi:hypothetical protein
MSRRAVVTGLAGTLCAPAGGSAIVPALARPAGAADEYPAINLANSGPLRATVYPPDSKIGYYRGTRFDWSGVIGSLRFGDHVVYEPWYHRRAEGIRDFVFDGDQIVAGVCSGVTGPVDEFSSPTGGGLGFAEAKPGGTFIKIGVGVLRKGDTDRYDAFTPAEIVDHGKWNVTPDWRPRGAPGDSVAFRHEVADPSSGYAYAYDKTVRLVRGEPVMLIEHKLHNTGKQTIETSTYNHNFQVLNRRPTGPEFGVRLPFAVRTPRPLAEDLAKVEGQEIRLLRPFTGKDTVYGTLEGFGPSARDYDLKITQQEPGHEGLSVRITGDRPLARLAMWGIRTTLCLEPFISIKIAPGEEFRWTYTYRFAAIPASP